MAEIILSCYSYAKANNKFIKYHQKNKRVIVFSVLNVNAWYGWAMSQKLTCGFKWVEETSRFNEHIIKAIMMIAIKNIFLGLVSNV